MFMVIYFSLKSHFLKTYYLSCEYTYVSRGAHATVHVWKSEDSFQELFLSILELLGIELGLSSLAASSDAHMPPCQP